MKYIYINEEEAIKGNALVHAVSDEKIKNYKNVFLEMYGLNVVEFYGDNLPNFITYDKELNTIREATKQELYDRGQYQLSDGEYIKNNIIKTMPICPEEIIKGEFDFDIEAWIETATAEEIEEHNRLTEELEYAGRLPNTVKDMDGRLYVTQEMLDMVLFEIIPFDNLKTMPMMMATKTEEEDMTTQAIYYYDRIVQKEKREGIDSAKRYYEMVVLKFPQYREDIIFLLTENDKEYIIY